MPITIGRGPPLAAATVRHIVLEDTERLCRIGGLADSDQRHERNPKPCRLPLQVEVAARGTGVGSVIFHELGDEPTLSLSVIETPWVAEERPGNAGRSVDLSS